MAQVITTRMTLEEFLESDLADAEPSWEYGVSGRLTRKDVAPSSNHSLVQGTLTYLLMAYALEHPELQLVPVPEVRAILPQTSPVPDFSVYRGPFRRGEKYPLQPLLLAVEILSPGQTQGELTEKVREMLAEGAAYGLVIDPERREVLAVDPASGDRGTLHTGDDLLVIPVPELAGLRLTPNLLFARLP